MGCLAEFEYDIRARSDPQTLPRLIGFIAQIGSIPASVIATDAAGVMTVRIRQSGLSDRQASIIAEKMRSSFLVDEVAFRRIDPVPSCCASG